LKLRDIAERLQCALEGDGDIEIVGVAGVAQARGGDLTFVANTKYAHELGATRASAVILGRSGAEQPAPCAVLRTDDPYSAFARAVALFAPAVAAPTGIDPSSVIAADATLGADVSVGAFVTIGAGASIGARTIVYPNVVIAPRALIGADCIIHSHVSIRERVVIGDRVTLLDGAVIGSDGFGFARQKDGTHLRIPQHADVVIEDDVEIGANSTIDRPAVGETRIGAGTKIDNLVHIAHGVAVGRRVLMAAHVGIAGSTVIGDDVMMGGQAGAINHLRIGNRVMVGAKSAVMQSVDDGLFVSGYPAIPQPEWLRSAAVYRQLPTLKKRVQDLEARIAELEEKLAEWQRPKTDR
jgi:UDP-3-O-[3-hydroxymyristoyl] glucosamine N-acyltransferase